jgi:exodeoxyribonuclease V alpha subunit
MLDTRLAAALLQAVPSRAHLLLVGDTDQLPSVGAGNVLKDLIATERQPSTLPSRASSPARHLPPEGAERHRHHRARHQRRRASLPPVVSDVAKAQAWSDLNFIAATDAEDCLRKVIELCTEFIPQALKWFDPVNDVQVLAPMHKGVAGVANLNRSSRPRSIPTRAASTVTGEFRPGDKVIQLRNNYDKNLFNGDIGTVRRRRRPSRHADGRLRRREAHLRPRRVRRPRPRLRHQHPQVAGQRISRRHRPAAQGALHDAAAQPALHRDHARPEKSFLVGEPAAYAMAVRNSEPASRSRC